MINLSFIDSSRRFKDPLNSTISKIKKGDRQSKEKFINDYKPFIIKSVSRIIGKFIEIENSEEYSVGLLAFNESIDCFDEKKNPDFFSFSQQVIKRRVLNYIKSNKKNDSVFPFTYFENEENGYLEQELYKTQVNQYDSIEIREELSLFKKNLADFGISLEDLLLFAPKHRDSKILLIKIARIIAYNNELFEKLERKKNMPSVDLLKKIKVNIKTLERNRKFIIAVSLILRSDLDTLKDYISGYLENPDEGGEGIG